MYSEEEEGKKWTGQPTNNPYYKWYWDSEKNREDPRVPRVPTDKDVEHAKRLEMITEAVDKHCQNTGVPNAKLTIPRHQSMVICGGYVNIQFNEVLYSTLSPFAFSSCLMDNL